MEDNSTKEKIRQVSRKNWKVILSHATKLSPKVFRNIHQPCPLCRKGEDRYRFDDKKGEGSYFCSKCGAGNGFTFLEKRLQISHREVITLLDDLLGITSGKPKIDLKSYADIPDVPDVRVIVPAPIHCKKPYFYHFVHKEPSMIWEYRNQFGDICFYTVRFDHGDGKKDVLPLAYCHYFNKKFNKMDYGWRWKGVTRDSGFKRPLYNLVELIEPSNVEKWVIVVEGERAADSAANLFPELVATTWSGGTKSIDLTDWSPLIRRNIIIFPDHDAAGYSAALELREKFLECNNTRKVILVAMSERKELGWDLADAEAEGLPADEIKSFIHSSGFEHLYTEL